MQISDNLGVEESKQNKEKLNITNKSTERIGNSLQYELI